jgi:uncharacterized membrane protein YeaQ/YmgE (transglycosylase-associated protein family)
MNVRDILGAIIVGAVVGMLGRLVLPGRQRLGAFATFVIGIGAALLGLLVSRALHLNDNAPAHVWFVHWHWYTLGIQVLLAVILIGIANVMTYTRLADGGAPAPGTRRRRRRTSSSRS